MSKKERARVVDSLPNEVTDAELSPPEGDRHYTAKSVAVDTLRKFFGRSRRDVYVAAELPVYYPDEPRFAPDLLVVIGASSHERDKWVVSAEGRPLSFVLEVHVGGDRKKDAERNVAFYAHLGIPEYFIYDRGRQRLWGYRLENAKRRKYQPILPQLRRFRSEQLDLDLTIEDEKLRFYYLDAALPESAELISKLERLTEELQRRVDAEAERAEVEAANARAERKAARAEKKRATSEAERATSEAKRASEAEARVKELERELKKLREK